MRRHEREDERETGEPARLRAGRGTWHRGDGARGERRGGEGRRGGGRDDRGRGEYTPAYGFILKNLDYSVVSGNTLHSGYLKEKILDLGGHGKEFVLKDNVGCPMLVPAK